MKKLLFLLIALTLTVNLSAQRWTPSWAPEDFYEKKGDTVYKECSEEYRKFNEFGQYIGSYQCLQMSVWHQVWRQGDVHVWNPGKGKWDVENKEGNFWYFTWKDPEEVYLGR